jgi:hypothetical protein
VTGVVQANHYIIDDGDEAFDAGGFRHDPRDSRFYQNDYHFQAPGVVGRAAWNFTDVDPGVYAVSATWFEWGNRATNALFRAFDGDAAGTPVWTVAVNQRQRPDGAVNDGWQQLGLLSVSGDKLTVDVGSGPADGYVIADAVRIDYLGPPLLATVIGSASNPNLLAAENIESSMAAAKQYWLSNGLTRSEQARLDRVQVQIVSLPGPVLGYTSAYESCVYIDVDAAGYGWKYEGRRTKYEGRSTKDEGQSEVGAGFLDSSTAILHYSNTPLLHYSTTPVASGGMDLVTVLAHELGHVLGRGHDDDGGLMSATLAAGESFEVGGPDFRFPISDWRFSDEAGGLDVRGIMPEAIWQEDFQQEHSVAGPFSCPNFSASQNLTSDDSVFRPPPSALRLPPSALRLRDAVFARLGDRAGAMDDDYDSLVEQDDSPGEAEDGLDLWSLF